ncbi:MAG: hypothetical protein OJF48_003410 [Afipia sp.]|nr:MAG: hypothetical protein OJF48_003410 [Afipia sp.]
MPWATRQKVASCHAPQPAGGVVCSMCNQGRPMSRDRGVTGRPFHFHIRRV